MSNCSIFANTLSVYRQNQFPVLQNRVYSSVEEARNCVLGDIDIVQDLDTGLIFNAAFKSDVMVYDANYNNEQGKFLPVTGLKVYSPRQAMMILKDGETVYVMNQNYLAEVKEMTNQRFNYKEANQ